MEKNYGFSLPVYLGKQGSLAVFSSGDASVVIDTELAMLVNYGKEEEILGSQDWNFSEEYVSEEILNLAEIALGNLNKPDENSLIASARLYTIPAGVKAEAKKALEWRKEHKRGGTPVGLNTARTLARGGQIGIEKIRHIAKYFPRHEVDKKGKGWKPGQDNFPSNGRIAWALWGGDAAWRWAKAIVERENNKPVRADGFYNQYGAELNPFIEATETNETAAPDFLARVRMDGSGIDRVYKIDISGQVYVWDDGTWDDLGHIEGDVWTYDSALDDPYDTCEKSHVQIDPDSAILICAKLQNHPFKNISIADIDREEAEMFAESDLSDEFGFIDSAITAATGADSGVSLKSTVKTDGQYTPEERSKNASSQVRDAGGKFSKQGGRVVVGGDRQNGRGTITSVNPDKSLTVKLDSGKSINVDAKSTRDEASELAKPQSLLEKQVLPDEFERPLDVSGILGEPRTPQGVKGQLPGTLPALTPNDLHSLLKDWNGWVAGQRQEFKRFEKPEIYKYGYNKYPGKKIIDDMPNYALISDELTTLNSKEEDKESWEDGVDSENKDKETPEVHPLLTKWKDKQDKPEKNIGEVPEWAKPVVAAGEAKKSDVPPVYLAIVAPDDPRAVLDLISIVPASATSNDPMTYVRRNKKWERDPKYLNDLKSATPPPVVPLDASVLNDVLIQVDGLQASAIYDLDHTLMVLWGPDPKLMNFALEEAFEDNLESLLSAGGADRNRGNAEELRRYWTRGKGAAKIRWGTPGDWKRCVRHLSKYLGVRAKGYCQLRHKEATGVYTGSRLNPGNENSTQEFIMEEVWGKNTGKPTVITDKDMLMPIQDIMREKDDIYDHHWNPDNHIVSSLKELAKCSDEEYALVAGARPPSGFNFDKNRKNAEKLRRYWTVGKGAAKIRWNTGGDWTRCVRHLSKYIGPRAKGYCALRHKEMTGMWTGDRKHLQMYGRNSLGKNLFSTEVINNSEKVIEVSQLVARANDAKNRVGITASTPIVNGLQSFVIPLVIPEEVESGDGRSFEKGAISFRELPLPLMWQTQTAEGHNGSVVVGRIDHMERTENGIGNAYGVFDTGSQAQEVIRLLKNGFIRGISADMDRFEAVEKKSEIKKEDSETAEKTLGKDKIIINKARVMGVTIVPKPAFQECKIILQTSEELINQQEEPLISDGIYADDADSLDAQSLVACGFVAGAIPVTPPKVWFANPNLDKPTPLTVTDEGKVFGHIAAWHVDHIGLAYGTKPPRSKSNYSYFHTGVVRTESGDDVPVGQLTLAGGHASLHASAEEAVRHYDDTASAVADVHAGEDRHGIWVAGSLRPGTTPEQIRALRASAPSGDWRPIRGSLELVAVCQVNVPGFPIARARVASGAVMALVAAGASALAKMKHDPLTELSERLSKLEMTNNSELVAKAESARAVFAEIKAQKNDELLNRMAELSSRFDGNFEYLDDFAFISRRERKDLAEKGEALPDGSFPIRNEGDLKNAIHSYGRSTKGDRAKVRRHIIKRARQLKRGNLIPDNWKTASIDEATSRLDSMRSKIAEFSSLVAAPVDTVPYVEPEQDDQSPKSDAVETEKVVDNTPTVESGLKVDGKYTPQTQPRDESGKFRQVLARLKQDLGTSGLQDIVDEAKKVDKLHEIGNYVESAGAAVNLLDILNRLDTGALNKVSVENVRSSARELGKVISNLPLGFNNQAEKVRYSDLPPSLQNLMDDMMTRVEAKIGKDDAAIANADLNAFRSGSDVYSQGEISSQMSKLLRLLT
jgi:hypothetical protein